MLAVPLTCKLYASLQGIGHSLSRYASLILRSDDDMEHDNAGEAYPVHPDSLQLLSKQSTPQTDPPKLSKTRTAEEDWYDRLNSDARTPIKPASYKATPQFVEPIPPRDLCHLPDKHQPHLCTTLLTSLFPDAAWLKQEHQGPDGDGPGRPLHMRRIPVCSTSSRCMFDLPHPTFPSGC